MGLIVTSIPLTATLRVQHRGGDRRPPAAPVCHRTGTDDAPLTHHGVGECFSSVGQLRDHRTARSPPKPGDCKAAGPGGNEVVKGHGTCPEEWSPVGVSL